MNDKEIAKREEERDHLSWLLDAYRLGTGETLEVSDSETPDFVGCDAAGRTVGIEITRLRFGPEDRHVRMIVPPTPTDDDAWWQLLELMHKKELTLTKGHWVQCDRKILSSS
jgi:hypothetical protein